MAVELLTPLAELAGNMHEFFTTLQEAGFTESQALTIVIGMSKNGED